MPPPRFIPAPPDLSRWLEAAVVVDSPAALAQSRFPAMVSSMLVVRLAGQVQCRGAPVPQSAWISPSTTATVYAHHGRVHAVGLVLRPEAAAALFASTRGLVDAIRPMAELAGARWAEAERGVLAAADDAARVDVLWGFVRQAVAASPPNCEERRVQGLALLGAACNAGANAGQRMGLSTRQFERRFVAHWGMSPRQFRVIARLNTALQHAAAEPQRQGADLAVDHGYYDQSHMARDVRRLAGEPLQALVQQNHPDAAGAHWPLQIGAQTLLRQYDPDARTPPR